MSNDVLQQRLALHVGTTAEQCASLHAKKVTLHVLRHTAAMNLLQAAVDITVIALWLDHESVATTQIYLHADLTLKQQALDRTTPPTTPPDRYQPPDHLLAFLESLSLCRHHQPGHPLPPARRPRYRHNPELGIINFMPISGITSIFYGCPSRRGDLPQLALAHPSRPGATRPDQRLALGPPHRSTGHPPAGPPPADQRVPPSRRSRAVPGPPHRRRKD